MGSEMCIRDRANTTERDPNDIDGDFNLAQNQIEPGSEAMGELELRIENRLRSAKNAGLSNFEFNKDGIGNVVTFNRLVRAVELTIEEKYDCYPSDAEPSEIKEKVHQIAAETFGVPRDKITDETRPIQDLGAESIDVCEFLIEVRNQLNLDVPDEAIDATKNVGGTAQWADSIALAK